MIKNLLLATLISVSTLGCALEPTISNDFSGLDDSLIGNLLRQNVHNANRITKANVASLIRSRQEKSEADSKKRLQEAGMKCAEAEPFCAYHGVVKTRLVMPDGSVMPRNNRLISYDIQVNTATDPLQIKINVINKPN
jgi:hypothetical protein